MSAAGLKDLYERKARVMARRPAFARKHGRARAEVEGDRLDCQVDLGDRTLLVDLPTDEGGAGSGPHPGQLMRASLVACSTIGYRVWAARLGVSIQGVEVELDCEYDERGQMGLGQEVTIGWQRIVLDVRVTSRATEEEVRRVVQTADRLSPMLANLSPASSAVTG